MKLLCEIANAFQGAWAENVCGESIYLMLSFQVLLFLSGFYIVEVFSKKMKYDLGIY